MKRTTWGKQRAGDKQAPKHLVEVSSSSKHLATVSLTDRHISTNTKTNVTQACKSTSRNQRKNTCTKETICPRFR